MTGPRTISNHFRAVTSCGGFFIAHVRGGEEACMADEIITQPQGQDPCPVEVKPMSEADSLKALGEEVA